MLDFRAEKIQTKSALAIAGTKHLGCAAYKMLDTEAYITTGDPKLFAILICTYNGEKYLIEQMQSFLEQTNENWCLHISDDGSTDRTINIIEEFRSRVGCDRVFMHSGPKAGFAQNYMSLICNTSIKAKYYAFSDQDDLWEAGKLDAALNYLKDIDPSIPSLYCGRTIFVDQDNKFIGLSDVPQRPPSFQNALIQNIASGNSMIINEAARKILMRCGSSSSIVAHDWLVYILVTGCGGIVFYDQKPFVRYRQHNKNLIGMNTRVQDKIKRMMKILKGDLRRWNENNIESLHNIKWMLKADKIQTLEYFHEAHKRSGIAACVKLKKAGVHRQTSAQSIALYLAAFLGKI